jgi:hypothetical protein
MCYHTMFGAQMNSPHRQIAYLANFT